VHNSAEGVAKVNTARRQSADGVANVHQEAQRVAQVHADRAGKVQTEQVKCTKRG
jgi:hypothetical protein